MDALLCCGDSSDAAQKNFPLFKIDVACNREELKLLLSKEEINDVADVPLVNERDEAVDWIVRVIRHYNFSCLTPVLASNYLDRFLVQNAHFDKPWMVHLAAVACLSLASKVEETDVPLLIDLQVEGALFYFEAKTIRKMEMVILTTLGWKMHPVTAISFLDCFIEGIGLTRLLSPDLLRRSEGLIVAVLADHRATRFPPSIVAPAVMVHVVKSQDRALVSEFELQLLSILPIEMGKYEECRQLIKELCFEKNRDQSKRPFTVFSDGPLSPGAVIEISFSPDTSLDTSDADSAASVSVSSKRCKV